MLAVLYVEKVQILEERGGKIRALKKKETNLALKLGHGNRRMP